MRISFISLIILLFGLFACEKPKDYSFTPEIKIISTETINGTDALGNPTNITKVRFNFIDGDGDLGLDSWDTTGAFAPGKEHYHNLKFQLYEKENGEFVLNEQEKNYFRFQNISKTQTTNKVIKGDMIAELFFSKETHYADTIKLSFYIYDRELNKSNIEETDEIFLNE